jgi:lysophospholipase L1-like esterase
MQKLKVVCHGDSLTEGYDIDLSKRWSDLLRESTGLEIINTGISGDTTAGMLARFKSMVIDQEPTHVIIMGGTNDVSHRIPFDHIISNIHAMTRQARHFGIGNIIGLPTPIFMGSTKQGSHEWDLMTEFTVKMEQYNARLNQFALDDDWPIIDFGKNMSAGLFLNDGVHPNVAGQKVMMQNAERILAMV